MNYDKPLVVTITVTFIHGHHLVVTIYLHVAPSPCRHISYVQHAAQAKVLCGLVQVFAEVKVSYILTTCPYFDNLEFDIFDAGGPQCRFITSVTICS